MDLAGPLMLLFTPGLVPGVTSEPGAESAEECRRALDVLARAVAARVAGGAPAIGAVQVRVKAPGARTTPARATLVWAERVRELLGSGSAAPALLVNDRIDVALAMGPAVRGVHLGQDDMPIAQARALLGPEVWIGRSTHDFAQVLGADEEGADYLGFGPVFPTTTKGYAQGLGGERAWIASEATALPVFAIGGIGPDNVDVVAQVGRAAVSSAILAADDPARVATSLAEALLAG